MSITLTPQKVTRFFGFIVLLLTLAHLAVQFAIYVLGYNNLFGLTPLLSLNAEHNIPALYSTVSLLFCAVLLTVIAYSHRQRREQYIYHWAGLAAIFLFLALDESLSFHESSTVPLRKALNTEGLLFYAWIIPYSLALVILLVIYLRFILQLPRRTRTGFFLAAILYITGAMLFELPAGIYDANFGRHNPVYAAVSTVEELLEMGGILVFIHALVSYISVTFGDLEIHLSAAHETA